MMMSAKTATATLLSAVERGLCPGVTQGSEVQRWADQKLLNGIFGVSKEGWLPDGTLILRLIMNVTPL